MLSLKEKIKQKAKAFAYVLRQEIEFFKCSGKFDDLEAYQKKLNEITDYVKEYHENLLGLLPDYVIRDRKELREMLPDFVCASTSGETKGKIKLIKELLEE